MTTPERYEDTTDPKNPPNSIMHPRRPVRSVALYLTLALLLVVFVVIGVAAIFWLAAHPAPTSAADNRRVPVGSGYYTEGGHNPDPRPSNTRDELKYRGF
jgi:hypothetical protein